jgi:hypothetical protein
MIYLKHVNADFKKQLETKYQIGVNLIENVNTKAFNIVLVNCPNNLQTIIEKEIKDECLKKCVKDCTTQYLPGFGHVVTKKDTFKQELVKISSMFFKVIEKLLLIK